MAKKNPTTKNIKQGHTIYVVSRDWQLPGKTVILDKYFMYSHNEPLPPEHCTIEKMPVNFVRKHLARNCYQSMFFSLKKALTAKAIMQTMIDKESK